MQLLSVDEMVKKGFSFTEIRTAYLIATAVGLPKECTPTGGQTNRLKNLIKQSHLDWKTIDNEAHKIVKAYRAAIKPLANKAE